MRIGEVSQRSGVSVRMLRHYDRIGLVSPSSRTSTGYREYLPADLRRLFAAEALRTLGLSLAQVSRALDDPGFDAAHMVDDLAVRTEQRIATERSLLARLRQIQSTEPHGWEEVLDVVGLLSALRSGTPAQRQEAVLRAGSQSQDPASGPRVAARLVDGYLEEPDAGVAGAMRWAIGRDPEPAIRALAARRRDVDRTVRLRVVQALDDIAHPAADVLLNEFLGDPDLGVAGHSALVLAGRDWRAAGVPPGELIRRLAVMVVAGMDDVRAGEALAGLAADSDEAAGRVVAELEARLDAHGADSSAARSRIAQALGEVGGKASLPVLDGLAGDPDPEVRSVARYLLAATPRPGRTAAVPGAGRPARWRHGSGSSGRAAPPVR